jgi:hypothetical protein
MIHVLDVLGMNCPTDCLVQIVLFQKSSPICSVFSVISRLSCPVVLTGYSAQAVRSFLSWARCPVLAALPSNIVRSSLGAAVLSLLFWLPCYNGPVPDVISRLYCRCIPVLVFLSCRCLLLTVLFWSSCPLFLILTLFSGCPV